MQHPSVRLAVPLALVLALVGCSPGPDSSPSPTPRFTSDAEAFAAAEETFHAYIAALNEVDLSDPATFEAVYELTAEDALAGERKTLTQMHADSWTVAGSTEIRLVEPVTTRKNGNVEMSVCTDVSSVTVVDASGSSVVADDRGDQQSLQVLFGPAHGTVTGLAITSITGRSGAPLCEF